MAFHAKGAITRGRNRHPPWAVPAAVCELNLANSISYKAPSYASVPLRRLCFPHVPNDRHGCVHHARQAGAGGLVVQEEPGRDERGLGDQRGIERGGRRLLRHRIRCLVPGRDVGLHLLVRGPAEPGGLSRAVDVRVGGRRGRPHTRRPGVGLCG